MHEAHDFIVSCGYYCGPYNKVTSYIKEGSLNKTITELASIVEHCPKCKRHHPVIARQINSTKMNRKEIKIDPKVIIKYCKHENKMQQRVYQRKVQAKTMSQYDANRNYLIIRELGELANDLLKKDITWEALRKMISEIPDKKAIKKVDLFTSKI